ncbi:hypothetical protein [Microbacterium sp. Marseille-Q6965]|uniref:hypothetical protein n=1 Tax=Microbacterium sp. Marseille-Q6965 TaxID=2965072 RepID=UPI0021B801D6|nr:hypothetical protein [Microbacterium sp. Marseille-Q6965]
MAGMKGRRFHHRRTKREGKIVGDAGSTVTDVRVRYDDGSRDAWVQKVNVVLEEA